MFEQIKSGRTDLVFEFLAAGNDPNTTDHYGVNLAKWCAYHGDVSALKFLLTQGVSLDALGENFDLNGAVFHGHWRLCEFLLNAGADANFPLPETAETPLHAALCKTDSQRWNPVLRVLLDHGANPNCKTVPGVETGSFMRDCRTKGETPLHRAAAFADESAIDWLLKAGAIIDATDANGESPLSWASWHLRPNRILRKLCYGNFRIHPNAE